MNEEDQRDLQQENWCRERLGYQANQQMEVEMIRATLGFSHLAIKSAILVNGGAAVASLAFAGSLLQSGQSLDGVPGILTCFWIGVLAGAIAAGAAHVSQRCYARASESRSRRDNDLERKWKRKGHVFLWPTIGLVISCYVMFLVGCIWAAVILSNMPQ